MKNILLIFVLLITTISYSQITKFQVAGYKTLTTTERDALTVPGGERWQIYNSTTAQYEFWDGTAWVASSSSATNLGYTPSPTDGTVTSDTGTDATLSLRDAINSGLMTPQDILDIADKLPKNYLVLTKATYTPLLAENGAYVRISTGDVTLDATGLSVGFNQVVFNASGGNINLTSANTIEGVNNVIPANGHATYVLSGATTWTVSTPSIGGVGGGDVFLANTQTFTGVNTFTQNITLPTASIGTDGLNRDAGFSLFATLANNNTITGANTFTQTVTGVDPTAAQHFVTQAYGDANYLGAGSDPNAWKITGTTTVTNPQIDGDVTFSNAIELPNSTSGSIGLLTKGGFSLLHNFTNDGLGFGNLQNLFLGYNAGNFTSGDGITPNEGVSNVGIGSESLTNLTSGIVNVGVGNQTLSSVTSGNQNTAIGDGALSSITTADSNTGIGKNSLKNLLTTNYNTAIGRNSGFFVGAGQITNMTSGTNHVLLGGQTAASANATTNEIVIGYDAVGQGSNIAVIGDTNITGMRLGNPAYTPLIDNDLATKLYVDTSGGGGGIGGSIATNQIAFGSGVANEIAGSANLTYDGTDFNIGVKTTFSEAVIFNRGPSGLVGAINIVPGAGVNQYILFTGTDTGKSNGLAYIDNTGNARFSFIFGNDNVLISNRASNGSVEIRANGATAGGGGENNVAVFDFDKVTFTQPIIVPDPTIPTHVGNRLYNDGRYGQLAVANTWTADNTINANLTVSPNLGVTLNTTWESPLTTGIFFLSAPNNASGHVLNTDGTPVGSGEPVVNIATAENIYSTIGVYDTSKIADFAYATESGKDNEWFDVTHATVDITITLDSGVKGRVAYFSQEGAANLLFVAGAGVTFKVPASVTGTPTSLEEGVVVAAVWKTATLIQLVGQFQ